MSSKKGSMSGHAPETITVHGGLYDALHHPVTPPIYQTSTFAFENVDHGADLFAGRAKGYIYSRMGNPTVEALETCIAELEGGHKALACGSGMAAIHTALMAQLGQGDHLICSDAVYGPTMSLVEKIFPKIGITTTAVDAGDLAAVEAAFRPNTRAVFIETPGNPTLVMADIQAVCELAHARGAVVIVDNTFMSPILQQPFHWGADVVVHSLTKFLNGHADVVGGIIVVRSEEQYKEHRVLLNHFGGVLPPFESFLVHRGIKTLALRMDRHCENAMKVALFLEAHPAVEWVRYPGLHSHPQYELGRHQMKGAGALIAMELKGGIAAGKSMMNSVHLCGLAVSLGGVETLVQHPASMTHASMGPDARARANITDGLVRISVGIEHVDEIIGDLDAALSELPTGIPRSASLRA